jgi:hypothetical protein
MLLIALYPPLQLAAEFHRPQGNTLIEKGSSLDGFPGYVVPRDVIPQHHIERSGRATLLPITLDAHPLRSSTTEHQPGHIVGVTVIVDDDFFVLGEQVLEVSVRQSMWVRAKGPEDHEIGDVDDPDAELWGELPKKSGGGDDFECNLRTDTNQDDVRTETLIR